MDEPVEEDDERIVIEGMPFVAEKGFLNKYGNAFTLTFSEEQGVVLLPEEVL